MARLACLLCCLLMLSCGYRLRGTQPPSPVVVQERQLQLLSVIDDQWTKVVQTTLQQQGWALAHEQAPSLLISDLNWQWRALNLEDEQRSWTLELFLQWQWQTDTDRWQLDSLSLAQPLSSTLVGADLADWQLSQQQALLAHAAAELSQRLERQP